MSHDSERKRSLQLDSLCVHGVRRAESGGRPVADPLIRSANFVQSEASYRAIAEGRADQVAIYSRYSNPTVAAVETTLAALEGAERAQLFASGMAAMHAAIVGTVASNSLLVISKKMYGGTHDLVTSGLKELGFRVRTVDLEESASGKAPSRVFEGASLVVCESLANPTLEVLDLSRLAQRVHAAGAKLLVDATFASPVAQRPLEFGADLVMHSATKLLGGHSDLIAGVISGSREALDNIETWRRRAGGCLAPDAAWLLDRGLKTLALRVRTQSKNAQSIAEYLQGHAQVTRVLYPGLKSHPTFGQARRMLEYPGCMVSFELEGGDDAAEAFVRTLDLWIDAPSLGGVESLVSLPRLMSHAHFDDEGRAALGIGPGFVRLSVGIEDVDDLIADLDRALASLQRHSRPLPMRHTT